MTYRIRGHEPAITECSLGMVGPDTRFTPVMIRVPYPPPKTAFPNVSPTFQECDRKIITIHFIVQLTNLGIVPNRLR